MHVRICEEPYLWVQSFLVFQGSAFVDSLHANSHMNMGSYINSCSFLVCGHVENVQLFSVNDLVFTVYIITLSHMYIAKHCAI